MERNANTEIVVRGNGTRLASFMHYQGDAVNKTTIGRDVAWGAISKIDLNGT